MAREGTRPTFFAALSELHSAAFAKLEPICDFALFRATNDTALAQTTKTLASASIHTSKTAGGNSSSRYDFLHNFGPPAVSAKNRYDFIHEPDPCPPRAAVGASSSTSYFDRDATMRKYRLSTPRVHPSEAPIPRFIAKRPRKKPRPAQTSKSRASSSALPAKVADSQQLTPRGSTLDMNEWTDEDLRRRVRAADEALRQAYAELERVDKEDRAAQLAARALAAQSSHRAKKTGEGLRVHAMQNAAQ